jgi:hypothetical protein
MFGANARGRDCHTRKIEADKIVEMIQPRKKRGARTMADQVRCYIGA